jgi:quercetin dioxygenase-like cupin family protein
VTIDGEQTTIVAARQINMQETIQRSCRGERRRIVILAGYMEWVLTPAETNGHYCMLETVIPPRAGVPPHQHVDQEAFYVVEGTLEVARLGSGGLEWFPVAAGDSIHVPSNEIHGFRNASTTNARTLVTATAGLGAFFEEAGIPIAPGVPPPTGPPSAADIERVLTIARKHGHRFVQKQV